MTPPRPLLLLGLFISLLLLGIVSDRGTQIALMQDRLFNEKMEQLSVEWREGKTDHVQIESEYLAMLNGHPFPPDVDRLRLTFAVVSEADPVTSATLYARFIRYLETSIKLPDKPAAFELHVFRSRLPLSGLPTDLAIADPLHIP